MFPTPILLNNPGALEHTHDHWEGMTRLQDNKRFVRFISPKYGIRGMMKTLRTYESAYCFTTINTIITRYAPPSENNTEAYIIDVSTRTGMSRNQVLDLNDIDVLIKLAKAIVMHENGHPPDRMPANWYSEVIFHEAAVLALKEDK